MFRWFEHLRIVVKGNTSGIEHLLLIQTVHSFLPDFFAITGDIILFERLNIPEHLTLCANYIRLRLSGRTVLRG